MRQDEPIEQVFEGGKVSPALPGSDIGDIRDPFLVGLAGDKFAVEHISRVMVDLCLWRTSEDFPSLLNPIWITDAQKLCHLPM